MNFEVFTYGGGVLLRFPDGMVRGAGVAGVLMTPDEARFVANALGLIALASDRGKQMAVIEPEDRKEVPRAPTISDEDEPPSV